MLLVLTYSRSARTTLRNVCRTHEETLIRQFGRVALFEETEHGAFLALRLAEKHGDDVVVERTRPLNEFDEVPESVREAARAYEERDATSTPYSAFANGRAHPPSAEMRSRRL